LTRPEGGSERYTFRRMGEYLKSEQHVPEPHAFTVQFGVRDGSGWETYEVAFAEHDHSKERLDLGADFAGEHERQHAQDIQQRFANREVTTGQIVMFGLTGGLIPCPASITVLLICLQLKKFALGAVLVLCFSVGLAITMVAVGTGAALSVRHVSKRWSGFSRIAARRHTSPER
jgi:nickel/cobalt exporter